jgi:transcription initiation factor TFIID subunit 5
VQEYLESHGFDKAVEMFLQGIGDRNKAGNKETSRGDDVEAGGDGDGRRGSAVGKEAIFRAPEPVPIESTLKRNIPQAQSISASTMSDRISPEFEAQAKYIIEQLQKKAEAAVAVEDGDGEDGPVAGGSQESILDPSDRVEGYNRYRRWVDSGLELWRVSPSGMSSA